MSKRRIAGALLLALSMTAPNGVAAGESSPFPVRLAGGPKPKDPLSPALADRVHQVFRQYELARKSRNQSELVCPVLEALVPLVADLQVTVQEFADTQETAQVMALARRLKQWLPVLRIDLGRDYRLGATVSVDFTALASSMVSGESAALLQALDRFQHGPLVEFGRPIFVRASDCAPAYWCDSLEAAEQPLRDLLAAKEAQPCLIELVKASMAPALTELAATRCVCEKRSEAARARVALANLLDAGWPGLAAQLSKSLLAKDTRYYCNRCGPSTSLKSERNLGTDGQAP